MSYPFIPCKSQNQKLTSSEESLMSVTFFYEGGRLFTPVIVAGAFDENVSQEWFVPPGRQLVGALFLSSWNITYMKSLTRYHIFDIRYKFIWQARCQVQIYMETVLTYNHLLVHSSSWNWIKVHLKFFECVRKSLESTLPLTALRPATLLCKAMNYMGKWLESCFQ